MQVQIRDTELDDIPSIFRLRSDPAVVREQYRPGFFDTPKSFAKKLDTSRDWQGVAFRCTSVLVGDELVGHIMRYEFRELAGPVCHCGWNLEPRCWGQGIMPTALTSLFDEMLGLEPRVKLMAACFASNFRGLRVIEKLGFERCRVGIAMRIGNFIAARGNRKVVQFRLTSDKWNVEKGRTMA